MSGLAGATPPTEAGAVGGRAARWPRALGAACMALGGASVLMGMCLLFAVQVGRSFRRTGGGMYLPSIGGIDVAIGYPEGAGVVVLGIVRAVLGAWLFVAGLRLARRHGSRLLKAWGWTRLVVGVAEVGLIAAGSAGWIGGLRPMVRLLGSDMPGLYGPDAVTAAMRLAVVGAWPAVVLWWLSRTDGRASVSEVPGREGL